MNWDDLLNLWNSIVALDAGMPGFYALYPNIPNPQVWYNSLTDLPTAQTAIQAISDKTNAIIAANTAQAAFDAGINEALKRMDWGRRIIAMVGVYNNTANATTDQIAQMASTFAPIAQLLQTGALDTASGLIAQITTIDPTLKQNVLDEIAKFTP